MRSKIILILSAILLFTSKAFSAPGWLQLNTGVTTDFNGIHFINVNTGFVTGNQRILKTTDGGSSWTVVNTASPNYGYIHMFDANAGFIGSNTGLLKTTDGGVTTLPAGPTGNYKRMQFIDNNNGWYLTSHTLFRTTNGGINWTSQAHDLYNCTYLYFADQYNGWLAEYHPQGLPPNVQYYWSIKRTFDGGATWNYGNASGSLGSIFNYEPTVYFYNTTIGYLYTPVGTHPIKRTTDGGSNWQDKSHNSSSMRDYHFASPDTGWISGWSIQYTTDGGATWANQLSATVYEMFFLNSTTGWAASTSGKVYKTVTGGITSVEPGNGTISGYKLEQNYPNPFNPVTRINYELQITNYVQLNVYDVNGKLVSMLVNEKQNPGRYNVTFDGSYLASGVYYYELRTDGFKEIKKMLLIK